MSKENKPEEAEAVSQDLSVDDQPPFDNRFAMLHLNGFNCHNYHQHQHQHQPCTTCGCLCSTSNPMKRRSPSPSSSFQDPLDNTFSSDSEPKPKKLFQDPVLRRTVSDPDPFPSGSGFQALKPNNSLSPEQHPRSSTGTVNVIPVTPSSNPGLPPLPPTLRRTISDPTPSPAKTYSRSSSSGDVSVDLTKEDTPNSNSNSKKRLRRMKDCMREMSKWCEEVMREQEDAEEEQEQDEEQEDTNVHAVTKNNSAQDFEESVFVERVGEEGLTVHFKCPCGKGYQILLSGRNCYYKLM